MLTLRKTCKCACNTHLWSHRASCGWSAGRPSSQLSDYENSPVLATCQVPTQLFVSSPPYFKPRHAFSTHHTRDYAKRNVVKQCYFHILSYFWMWLISILLEFVLHRGKFCFCIFFYSKLTLAQHRNEEGGWLNYSLTEIENNVWLLYKSVCFNRVPVPKLLWIMTTSISPQQRPRYVKYCQCEPLTKS